MQGVSDKMEFHLGPELVGHCGDLTDIEKNIEFLIYRRIGCRRGYSERENHRTPSRRKQPKKHRTKKIDLPESPKEAQRTKVLGWRVHEPLRSLSRASWKALSHDA